MSCAGVLVLHDSRHADGAVLFGSQFVIVVLRQVGGITTTVAIIFRSVLDLEREPCLRALVVGERCVLHQADGNHEADRRHGSRPGGQA